MKASPRSFNIQPVYHQILKELSKSEGKTIAGLFSEAVRLLVLNRLANRKPVNLQHLQQVLNEAGLYLVDGSNKTNKSK